MHTIFSAHKSKIIPTLLLALLLVCTLRAVALSFHWGLIHDGITMQYIGLMLLHGVLPYRDIFDMNFPLTYWIHSAGIVLLGKSDIATRSYDLLWCYFGAFAIAACIWRQGRALALAAGMSFALLHLAGGYMNQLQRDMLMVPFLVGGIYFSVKNPRPLMAGLLLGAACSIKPIAAIFALILLLLTRPRHMPAYLVGLAIVPVLAWAWMTATGIFPYFWDILWNFTLPVFASSAFEDTFPFLPEVPFYAVVALIFHIVVWRRALLSRESLLLAGALAYGLLHYYGQQKGYGQHLYPFWAMLCMMVAWNMARLSQTAPHTVAIAALVAVIAGIALRPQSALWIEKKWFDETPLLAASNFLERQWMLEGLPERGSTVQVLEDVFGTAWRIAYRRDWKPAVRFMYPFILYAAKDQPVMQRYREEFIASLLKSPPKMILLSSFTWPQYKAVVFKEFENPPAMRMLLRQHYVGGLENKRMKLWLRKY